MTWALVALLAAPQIRGFNSVEDIRLGVEGHYGAQGFGVCIRGESAEYGLSRFGVSHFPALAALTTISVESRVYGNDLWDLNWNLLVLSRGFNPTTGNRGEMGFGGGLRGRWLSLYPVTPHLVANYQMMPGASNRPAAHGFRALAGGEVQLSRFLGVGAEGGYWMLGSNAQPVWNAYLMLSL